MEQDGWLLVRIPRGMPAIPAEKDRGAQLAAGSGGRANQPLAAPAAPPWATPVATPLSKPDIERITVWTPRGMRAIPAEDDKELQLPAGSGGMIANQPHATPAAPAAPTATPSATPTATPSANPTAMPSATPTSSAHRPGRRRTHGFLQQCAHRTWFRLSSRLLLRLRRAALQAFEFPGWQEWWHLGAWRTALEDIEDTLRAFSQA